MEAFNKEEEQLAGEISAERQQHDERRQRRLQLRRQRKPTDGKGHVRKGEGV
jgi:hypothetical protein